MTSTAFRKNSGLILSERLKPLAPFYSVELSGYNPA